jgi:C-methyltransferase C-terminal domain
MLMPGVHIDIVDPSIVRDNPPDYFLVLAWNYIDSILEQEKQLHDS